ncbi:unnamed protein product, partial [Mesorhabditis belari]|uniref:Uncharacterized protein n=1 Tax=Mesorhabditis belari TaxID=2138241 RepID=A0AAF3EI16_9BILA
MRFLSVKYVVWSANNENAALISKSAVILVNRRLEVLYTVTNLFMSQTRMLGWKRSFGYTHKLITIKYALVAGDSGIVRTLDVPLYLLATKNNSTCFACNREAQPVEVPIDATEYRFKLALINRRIDEVLNTVKSANLVGHQSLAIWKKKGILRLEIHFQKDEKTRFGLALKCGNLDVALETAKVMDEKPIWGALLGEAAVMHGNHQIVRKKTGSFGTPRLSYLVPRKHSRKLSKMMRIAEIEKRCPWSFPQRLSYLGDGKQPNKRYMEGLFYT